MFPSERIFASGEHSVGFSRRSLVKPAKITHVLDLTHEQGVFYVDARTVKFAGVNRRAKSEE